PDADPSPSRSTSAHPLHQPTIALANDKGSDASSVQPDPSHTVDHGRSSYSNGRPRGLQPRAPLTYAVRRGGPTTFTATSRQPGHDIFHGGAGRAMASPQSWRAQPALCVATTTSRCSCAG